MNLEVFLSHPAGGVRLSISKFYKMSGVFCLRFKCCLSFLWLRCRQVRLKITANAPIVMQMPNTIGKWTYQLSSLLIGLVDDAFVLSMKSVLMPLTVFSSGFHVDGSTVVMTSNVLFATPSGTRKKCQYLLVFSKCQFIWLWMLQCTEYNAL